MIIRIERPREPKPIEWCMSANATGWPDWRQVLARTNQTLKRNKAFETAKIHGLLVVSMDANEQFKSRCRCCELCSQRQIKIKNRQGQIEEVPEYYHRFVCAQLHGAQLSVVLDLELIGPGEEEAAAALRLLGRMRRLYGPRFFDAVTVDAWCTTGPFIKAVQRLGWGVVAVLKQERYDIYQESIRCESRSFSPLKRHLEIGSRPALNPWN